MTRQTHNLLTRKERQTLETYMTSTTHSNTKTLIKLCLYDIDSYPANLHYMTKKYTKCKDYELFCSSYLDRLLTGEYMYVEEGITNKKEINRIQLYIDTLNNCLTTARHLVDQYNDPTTRY